MLLHTDMVWEHWITTKNTAKLQRTNQGVAVIGGLFWYSPAAATVKITANANAIPIVTILANQLNPLDLIFRGMYFKYICLTKKWKYHQF